VVIKREIVARDVTDAEIELQLPVVFAEVTRSLVELVRRNLAGPLFFDGPFELALSA